LIEFIIIYTPFFCRMVKERDWTMGLSRRGREMSRRGGEREGRRWRILINITGRDWRLGISRTEHYGRSQSFNFELARNSRRISEYQFNIAD
jgi:hypothetical protein